MNSLKTLMMAVVLAVIAYAVYVTITRNPQANLTPDNAPAWPGAPTAQIPGPGAVTPQYAGQPAGPTGAPGDVATNFGTTPQPNPPAFGAQGTPAFGAQGTQAPSFTPPEYCPVPTRASGTATPASDPSQGHAAPWGTASSPPAQGRPGSQDHPEPWGNAGAAPVHSSPTTPQAMPQNAGSPGPRAALAHSPGHVTNPFATQPSSPLPGQPSPGSAANKFLEAVEAKLEQGRLAEAHLTLSSLHGNPELPVEQAQKVTELLDRIAGTVIYSRQHLLEPPYQVQPGDTLEQIAQSYKVPVQLLARINGIVDPRNLQPGQELKVVRGPFSAVIGLEKYELTLMLNGRYAGRFPIGLGRDHQNLAGSYVVRDKTVNPTYYGPDRVDIPADDPNNPLGEFWIGLGNQIGIHGTNDPRNLHRTGDRGSICMGDQDIDDVFGILAIGSRVIIRR